MKIKRHLILFSLLLLFFTSCEKEEAKPEETSFEVQGTLQPMGISTYMYGTHKVEAYGKFYALKSSTIDLNQYLDKTVKISGDKIAGYPVDGGPDYIEVKKVVE